MTNNKSNGFSLLEVIIAIAIITIALVGILSLTNLSLKASSTAKMRLIASGLAQEGVEIVRSIRRINEDESNWTNWHINIVDNDYQVQYDSIDLTDLYTGDYLQINADGLYQYDNGTETLFKRKITLNKISPNQLKVEVEVSWSDQSLIVEDELWDWK